MCHPQISKQQTSFIVPHLKVAKKHESYIFIRVTNVKILLRSHNIKNSIILRLFCVIIYKI